MLSIAVALIVGCTDGAIEPRMGEGTVRRRFEPRWSQDPPWHPCDVAEGPGLELVTCAPVAKAAAASAASREATRGGASDAIEASNVLDPAAIHRSISRLRAERRSRRAEPAIENDLAVALAVAAQMDESPVLLVHALGAIERAARLAPDDPVIRFNRALILGYLQLSEAAESAWREYLRLDSDSPWAGEAAQRLRRIAARRARRSAASSAPRDPVADPQRERHRLQELVLARWSEIDDPALARALVERELPAVERLAAATGDDLLLAGYRSLLETDAVADASLMRDLRQGHRLLARANLALEEGIEAETLSLLRQARLHLSRAGSPLWVWAEHGIIRRAYRRSDFARVESLSRELLGEVPASSAIAGRTWWVLGSARFGRGDFTGAEEAFRAASGIFTALGEDPNRRAVDSMLAALFEWVGRRESAWQARHTVLAQLSDGRNPWRLRLVLTDAAMAAAEFGEPEAALVLQDLAVVHAERDNDPFALANALLKRAVLIASAPGVPDERAEEDFERSAASVDQIVDPDVRERLRAELLLEWGRSDLSRGDHASAIGRLEAASFRLAEGDSPHLWLPEAHAALGRAHAMAGNHAAAEGLLRKAIAELDRQRSTANGVVDRIVLADRSDAIHEDLLRLLLDRGEGRAALDTVRRARSESWRTRTGAAATPTGTAAAPPPAEGVTVVTYAVLADRLAIWTEGSSELRLFQADLPRHELEELIATTRTAIAAGNPGALALLRDLHRILIDPIAPRLVGVDRLVVEADECLFGVPFAALLDDQGTFLIERHALSLAAASSAGSAATPAPGEPLRRLLAVADPAFAAGRYPHLERLPAAADEIVALAASYPEPVLLVDDEATERDLLRRLPNAEVVHVAAHGIASTRDPLASSLVLAPAADADGTLTVAELLEVELRAEPVVVLAACESIGGFFARADGPVGLAWPFLARGATSVVATLWEIDDRAVGDLVVRLHEELSHGLGAEHALRSAQLEAIDSNAPVEVWSPWVLLR